MNDDNDNECNARKKSIYPEYYRIPVANLQIDDRIVIRDEIFSVLQVDIHPTTVLLKVCPLYMPHKQINIKIRLEKKVLTYRPSSSISKVANISDE